MNTQAPFDKRDYHPSTEDERARQEHLRNIGRRGRYMIKRSQHDNLPPPMVQDQAS